MTTATEPADNKRTPISALPKEERRAALRKYEREYQRRLKESGKVPLRANVDKELREKIHQMKDALQVDNLEVIFAFLHDLYQKMSHDDARDKLQKFLAGQH